MQSSPSADSGYSGYTGSETVNAELKHQLHADFRQQQQLHAGLKYHQHSGHHDKLAVEEDDVLDAIVDWQSM